MAIHPNRAWHTLREASYGWGMVDQPNNDLPNAAPLQARLVAGSVGAIVLNFKSVTNRTRNRI